MIRTFWALLLTAPLSLGCAAALACTPGPDGMKMTGPSDTSPVVLIKTKPETPPVSQPFLADIRLCEGADKVERVSIDATMPAHRHGMNYKPTLKKLSADRYEVEGMLFHMPGVWRFHVTLTVDGKPHRYVHDVRIN